jgi:hypothetical protein
VKADVGGASEVLSRNGESIFACVEQMKMADFWCDHHRQALAAAAGRNDQFSLYKMKAALVRQQLRRGDMLNGNCVVRDIRDDGIAVPVIVGRRQKRGHVGKD